MEWVGQRHAGSSKGDRDLEGSSTSRFKKELPLLDLKKGKHVRSISDIEPVCFHSSRAYDGKKESKEPHFMAKYDKTLQNVSQFMGLSKDRSNAVKGGPGQVALQLENISRISVPSHSEKTSCQEELHPFERRSSNFSGQFSRTKVVWKQHTEDLEQGCGALLDQVPIMQTDPNNKLNIDETEFYDELIDKLQRAVRGEDVLSQQTQTILRLEAELRQMEIRRNNTEREKTILESVDGQSIRSKHKDSKSSDEAALQKTMHAYGTKMRLVQEQTDHISLNRLRIEEFEKNISLIDELVRKNSLLCMIQDEKRRIEELDNTFQIREQMLDFQLMAEIEKKSYLNKNLENLTSLVGVLGGDVGVSECPLSQQKISQSPSTQPGMTSVTNLPTNSGELTQNPKLTGKKEFKFSRTSMAEMSIFDQPNSKRVDQIRIDSTSVLDGELLPPAEPPLTKMQSLGTNEISKKTKPILVYSSKTPIVGPLSLQQGRRTVGSRVSVPQLKVLPLNQNPAEIQPKVIPSSTRSNIKLMPNQNQAEQVSPLEVPSLPLTQSARDLVPGNVTKYSSIHKIQPTKLFSALRKRSPSQGSSKQANCAPEVKPIVQDSETVHIVTEKPYDNNEFLPKPLHQVFKAGEKENCIDLHPGSQTKVLNNDYPDLHMKSASSRLSDQQIKPKNLADKLNKFIQTKIKQESERTSFRQSNQDNRSYPFSNRGSYDPRLQLTDPRVGIKEDIMKRELVKAQTLDCMKLLQAQPPLTLEVKRIISAKEDHSNSKDCNSDSLSQGRDMVFVDQPERQETNQKSSKQEQLNEYKINPRKHSDKLQNLESTRKELKRKSKRIKATIKEDDFYNKLGNLDMQRHSGSSSGSEGDSFIEVERGEELQPKRYYF